VRHDAAGWSPRHSRYLRLFAFFALNLAAAACQP
jgi:hypothetical protein